jgi:hypothetical protein
LGKTISPGNFALSQKWLSDLILLLLRTFVALKYGVVGKVNSCGWLYLMAAEGNGHMKHGHYQSLGQDKAPAGICV